MKDPVLSGRISFINGVNWRNKFHKYILYQLQVLVLDKQQEYQALTLVSKINDTIFQWGLFHFQAHWGGGTWTFLGGTYHNNSILLTTPYLHILNSILHLEPQSATPSSHILNYLIPPTPHITNNFQVPPPPGNLWKWNSPDYAMNSYYCYH